MVLLHALDPLRLDNQVVPHGALAVDFFFALSGFVVAYAYEDKLHDGMTMSEFLTRRAVRLYPMIATGLVLAVLVFCIRITLQHRTDLVIPVIFSTLLNAILLPSPFLLSEHGDSWPINSPHWSLSFEVLANVAYALGLFALVGYRFRLAVALAALCTGWMSYSMNGIIGGAQWTSLGLGLVRVAFPFLTGIGLYRIWRTRKISFSVTSGEGFQGTLWCCAILILVFLLHVPETLNGLYEGSVVLLIFPSLVFAGACTMPCSWLHPALLWLGRLSYPLYASHYPIIKMGSFLARKLELIDTTQLVLVALAEMVVAVLVAVLLLSYVDEPIRRWLNARLFQKLEPADSPSGFKTTPMV